VINHIQKCQNGLPNGKIQDSLPLKIKMVTAKCSIPLSRKLAAGGLAAALSTAAGLLLVISSSVSHDLVKKTFKPDLTDKQELWIARGAATVAVVIAGYFGIDPPGFVAAVVALAFGLAAASFFPAIVLGIFYKKMNKEGAVAGMIVGIKKLQ